jgi:hypothetical protein
MWVADKFWKIACLVGRLWGIFVMGDNVATCQLVNMSIHIAN